MVVNPGSYDNFQNADGLGSVHAINADRSGDAVRFVAKYVL
jgi:hypothetical protein